VKHNLPAAKAKRFLIVLASASLVFGACARLPRSTQSPAQLSVELPKTERAAQINVNTASAEELEKLPGVGKAIGERIVAPRNQYGPFRRAEHLMMVRGISDNKFRQVRNLITVE
jgi:competence ComEA-like helix-hairpin-helix protein